MKVFRSLAYMFAIVLVLNSSYTFAQIPNWKWCKSAVGVGKDDATAIAVDGSGNVYAAGNFRSASFNMGTVTLTNQYPTTTDVFFAKYNATGVLQWAKKMGGKGNEVVNDICVDALGNIYLTGNFESDTINLGNSILLLNSSVWVDPFVVKFANNGDAVWAKSAAGLDIDFAQGVAVDASQNVFITGYYSSDTLTFSKTPLVQITRAGVSDLFIAKYNNLGEFQWVKSAGGDQEEQSLAIAVDNVGNPIITGYFQSSIIQFGTFQLSNANNWSDGFITKYSSAGVVMWAKIITGDYYDFGSSIATDAQGSVYVCGDFSSDFIDIGSTHLVNTAPAGDNSDDIFVAKYNSSGVPQWANSAGGTAYDYAKGIAVDASGNCYVTGNFVSVSMALSTNTLTNTDTKGSGEIFVIKYMPSGGVIKALSAQSNGDDDSRSIAAYSNNAYIAGSHKANPKILFDAYSLTNSGNYDIVIAALGYGLSIKDEEFDNHFSVYPNPVHEKFSLSANGNTSGKFNCKIYDVTGKLLSESNVELKSNNVPQIDVPSGYKGLVMVLLTSENGQVYSRSLICK